MRREIRGFSPEVRQLIETYDWPGNIRQLSNTIERAVILEDDTIIHRASFSLPQVEKTRVQETVADMEPAREGDVKGGGALADQERNLILAVLEECLWVQKNAAAKLGISPRSLNYKINKLGIRHPHWRRNS